MTRASAPSQTAVEPVAWTNRANLRVLEQAEPLFYAVMWGENTAEWNVPLFDASTLTAQAAALVAAESNAERMERNWRTAAALVERHEATIEVQSNKLTAAETEVATLKARVAELEAGLEPFANFATKVATERPGWDHDDFRVIGLGPPDIATREEPYQMALEPFRRARRLTHQEEEQWPVG